jgi:tetratricopeptide (TPR) repeat protein
MTITMTRYTGVTLGLIEKARADVRLGRDLEMSIPGLSASDIMAIAEDSRKADTLACLDEQSFRNVGLSSRSDWELAIIAERFFALGEHERAWEALERILDTPEKSIMLWYEDIFLDVAEKYRGDGDFDKAIGYLQRALAHNLHHNEGNNACNFLRDLAEVHLEAGQLDHALTMYDHLLRHDPADIWTYNRIGFDLPRAGLVDLGLEAILRALQIADETGDPESLHDQLTGMLEDAKKAERRGRESEVSPPILAGLRQALHLPLDAGSNEPLEDLARSLVSNLDHIPVKRLPEARPLPRLQASEGSPTQLETLLEQLLEAGEHPDQDLLQAIQDQGEVAVPPLIEIATDPELIWADSDSPEVWAPTHAMHLLGRLQATAAIAPLLALLEREEEADWIRKELPDVLAQIGPAAIEPLKTFAADRNHNILGRSAACGSLVKIAQSRPETRQEVVDFLRALLPAYPDERPDDETFRGFVVADLLDLKAKEAYPDIEAAFVEDRVDELVVGLDDVQRELRIRDGAKPRERAEFEIRLTCQECGFTRPHAVDVVYCDLGTQKRKAQGEEVPYSEFIIPQRIVCPRCDTVDRYELSSEAYLAMTAELLKLVAHKGPTPGLGEGTKHLRLMHFTVEGGREMHPLAALETYQRRVEENPEDTGLRLRYANVLRFLRRWDEARAQYEQVQTLDPRNAEVYFALAQMAEMQENSEGALAVYEEYLSRVPRRPKGREAREMWDYAQDMVEALHRQQAGTLGRVASMVSQAGHAGARLFGLTGEPDFPTLPPEPEAPPQPRARRQDRKATRKTEKQARKAQRRSKKRKKKRK